MQSSVELTRTSPMWEYTSIFKKGVGRNWRMALNGGPKETLDIPF